MDENITKGFEELDYQTAIPICYCKPVNAADIIKILKIRI
jgi:hypothetical protein